MKKLKIYDKLIRQIFTEVLQLQNYAIQTIDFFKRALG